MFKKEKVISFEKVFWRISGMRSMREYEILKKDEYAEVSEYEMHYIRGGGDDRLLLRRVLCPEKEMLEILNMCGIIKWDGFHGKHPRGVKDGEMFSLAAVLNDEKSIKADGSENFPKGFREFRTAINNLLSKDTEK